MLGSSDQQKIKHLLEQVKEDHKEFEQCHLKVLNFIKEEYQDTLDTEVTAYDAHGSRVMDSVSHSTSPAEPSHSLINRIRYLEQRKKSIIESTKEIVSQRESHK